MNTVLVDAGPLVALLNCSDMNHKICARVLSSGANALVTCEPVVTEACHILRRCGVPAAAQDILKDVHRGEYRIPLQLVDRASAVASLMKKYADIPMSLADACLVDLATQLNTGRILTLDSDFQVYRWGRNRRFDLLIDLD